MIGLGLVVLAYISAIMNTFTLEKETTLSGKKVLMISHWQLELGFREGIDWMIAEYEKRNPDVKIIQNAISGRVYRPFLQTNLVGGTAPDLVEFGRLVDDSAVGRYFVPLSQYIYEPNEYNRDNEFRDTPWIYTFKDGLQSCWSPNHLEYFSVGLNMHTIRIYYNRDMYREIMGTDVLPQHFEELIDVCEKVEAHNKKLNKNIRPIATSGWQTALYRNRFTGSLTANYAAILDRDHDYVVNYDEKFISYLEDRYSMLDDEIRTAERMMERLTRYFQPGFMAIDMQEAGNMFTTERALMITSGSWDLPSYQANARFEIGVFDFPIPREDHPIYGKYVDGKNSESKAQLGSQFAVYRLSKYADVAIDFLKFASSKEINEKFCRMINWMPSIIGTEMNDEIKPFAPIIAGIPGVGAGHFSFGNPGKSNTLMTQEYPGYISNNPEIRKKEPVTYEKYATDISAKLPALGMEDFYQHIQRYSDGLRQTSHLCSYFAVQATLARDTDARPSLARYSSLEDEMQRKFGYMQDSFSTVFTTRQARVFEFVELDRRAGEFDDLRRKIGDTLAVEAERVRRELGDGLTGESYKKGLSTALERAGFPVLSDRAVPVQYLERAGRVTLDITVANAAAVQIGTEGAFTADEIERIRAVARVAGLGMVFLVTVTPDKADVVALEGTGYERLKGAAQSAWYDRFYGRFVRGNN